MPVDLEQQLAAYGHWLERRHATTLRPATPRSDPGAEQPTQLVEIGPERPARRRFTAAMVAAASILLIGVLGTMVVLRRAPSPPAAVSVQTDPPGPLYVLPSGSDVVVSDGNATMLQTEPVSPTAQLGYAATVGKPTTGGFEDLASVVTFTDFDTSSGDWVEGEYDGFPTWTFDTDFITWVAQDRGTWWVLVQTGPDRTTAVHDVLDHVTVDSSGHIAADATSSREIIDLVPLAGIEFEDLTATWTAAIAGSDEPNVMVQTITGPGVFFAGTGIERIEPTTINGVRAWRLISGENPPISDSPRDDEGFEPRAGVQWQFSPNRTLIVAGTVDPDTLERFAASLTQVTAEQWAAALPGFTSECTLEDPQPCTELPPQPPP